MFQDDLKKFRHLPEEARDFLSSKDTLGVIEEIEKKYQVKLALVVIKLAIGDIQFAGLENFLQKRFAIDFNTANAIKRELGEKIWLRIKPRLKSQGEDTKGTWKDEIQEDTQEIVKIKSAMPRTASGGVDYEQVATGILKELKFSSQEKILESRFRNIITAFLKDIRDAIETREMLLRSVKIGGLGLTEEQAEKVIKTLKQESKAREITEIDERRINTNLYTNNTNHESEAKDKEIIPKGSIGTEIDRRPGGIERFREEIKKAEKRFKAPYLEPEEEVGAPKETLKLESAEGQQKHKIPAKDIGMIRPEMAKPRSGPRTVWVDDVHHPSLPVPRPRVDEIGKLRKLKSATSHSSLVTRGDDDDGGGGGPSDQWLVTRDKQSVKPQMESARLTSRLVGPIEEIREASLVDFRRWSTDPKEAAERLKEKIEVLEEESWEKKALAIRAWHESALHNLYVEIGRESLERGEPVGEVIRDRRAEGRETLTQAEFEAIADLNRELRF